MALPMQLSRKRLLGVGVAGGAALILPRGVARAAATPPDGDLAYLRLLIGAELLALDFQTRALASHRLGPDASIFKRQGPATSADVDFTYPRGAFASHVAIARLGWRVESLLLGAYLGAIGNVETAELRLPIGQIAANEAQHLSAIAPLIGRKRVGRAFPQALAISAASDQLDAFES